MGSTLFQNFDLISINNGRNVRATQKLAKLGLWEFGFNDFKKHLVNI